MGGDSLNKPSSATNSLTTNASNVLAPESLSTTRIVSSEGGSYKIPSTEEVSLSIEAVNKGMEEPKRKIEKEHIELDVYLPWLHSAMKDPYPPSSTSITGLGLTSIITKTSQETRSRIKNFKRMNPNISSSLFTMDRNFGKDQDVKDPGLGNDTHAAFDVTDGYVFDDDITHSDFHLGLSLKFCDYISLPEDITQFPSGLPNSTKVGNSSLPGKEKSTTVVIGKKKSTGLPSPSPSPSPFTSSITDNTMTVYPQSVSGSGQGLNMGPYSHFANNLTSGYNILDPIGITMIGIRAQRLASMPPFPGADANLKGSKTNPTEKVKNTGKLISSS